MHILIVLNEPYPKGMACTNRVHNYAKGFKQRGHEVAIAIPRSKGFKGDKFNNLQSNGEHEGISFEYASGQAYRSSSFVKRRVGDIKGDLKVFFRIIYSRKRVDKVLLISNVLTHIILFRIATKLAGVKLIQEKSELPFYNKPKSAYRQWYVNNVFKWFDGIIVISQTLQEYIQSKVGLKTKLIQVPILVDVDEVASGRKESEIKTIKNVVYAGTLDNSKDGILYLLESFALLKERFNDVVLNIVGDTAVTEDKRMIRQKLDDLEITQSVKMHGYVSRDKLLELFNNASVLTLYKPSNEQAQFNFPSKIAEYLATGNPVVVTGIGEIPTHLTDGVNAFLAEPDSVESFTSKLIDVFQNQEKAKNVGVKGKELAFELFNYKTQSKRILDFFERM